MLEPDGRPLSPRIWSWTAVAAFLLVVGFAAPSLPRGVTNWDNVVKLQLARGLLRGDGFELRGASPDDAAYVHVGIDGRRYTGYLPVAPALQVLTIQVALLTGFEAEGVPALLVLGVLAAVLVSWGRRAGVPPGAAAGGAVLACLGTALWPMAALGYDVLVEALALALLLRAGASEAGAWRPWLVAGVALGAAFATRLGAACLAVPAIVLALAAPPGGWRGAIRRGAALAVGGAPGVALVAWYNVLRFGSPFTVMRPSALGTAADLGLPWLSLAHLEGMAGFLVSPGKGLFWYAPPMLFVAAAAPALLRRHRAAGLALAAYAVTAVVLFGRFRYWHGDWGWGPRYVSPLFVAAAPLAWLLAERVTAARARVRAGALAALVAAVALQAAPVIGRPVPYHFALVVAPLAAAGRLATRPPTRPPVPEDYGILYYAPQHSMLWSLARGLARAAAKEGFLARAARALVVPLAAGAFVAGAWAASARARRGRFPRALEASPGGTP